VSTLRLVLGDQLTRSITALAGIDPHDTVLMAEVEQECNYVPHHKQKIALILAAMRHFAGDLEREGVHVDYVKLDNPQNTGSFVGELQRAVARHGASKIIVTDPGEWRVSEALKAWRPPPGVSLEFRQDDRFFASKDRFARWSQGRATFRMEFFYREMRRETDILMDDAAPCGGSWNYDAQNRKALPKSVRPPRRLRFSPDALTRQVLELVSTRFSENFGSLEAFEWAVTRSGALQALDHFVAEILPLFGDYQDAMRADSPFLYHALISPYLNIGLLTPREVCARAEAEYRRGRAPLNAVEGFIRQILGWREYVRGIYWLKMPEYASRNDLNARRPLPKFYWTGETDMNCLRSAIAHTHQHAYSHHIQRLMITGNFALLAGILPQDVCDWYLAVYADAFDWVELPNTLGMSQFADGGLMSTKPYAASGAYINRMSDFCRSCRYDVDRKSGPTACPFNFLYWAFLIRNAPYLESNPRLGMPYRRITELSPAQRATIEQDANRFLAGLR
jgi:deoxyribodipyrimidine photolyase-related protein